MASHEDLLRRFQDALDRRWEERAERARTTDDFSILLDDAMTRHSGVHLAVLANPHITDEIFDAIDSDDVAVQLAMASHPSCSPAALERLALSTSPDVRALAAEHARSTDVGRAWALEPVEASGDAAASSQITAALLDPGAVAARKYLDLVEDGRSSALEWRREIIVAQHHRAPTDILQRVLEKVTRSLAAIVPIVEPRLALHEREPGGGALKTLTAIAVRIALHPSTTTPMLRTLATINEADVLAALARNPHTAKPNLKRLVDVDDRSVKIAVAAHPSRRVRDFDVGLYDLKDDAITRALAGNSHVRESVLDRIGRDTTDTDTIRALAGNAGLDETDLAELADHDDERVVAAVAGNPSTGSAVLTLLAQRQNAQIHVALATNPEATPPLLEQLYEDRISEDVAQTVLSHPRTPAALLAFAFRMEDAIYGLATNPKLPDDLQVQLARSVDSATVGRLAHNPNASATALVIAEQTLNGHRIDFDNAPPGREDPTFPAVERQALHAIAAHANSPARLLELLSLHRDLHIALTARISQRINA